jgi:UDP-N-acetylglucosamine:LPS N-acetylglucosamine transferase
MSLVKNDAALLVKDVEANTKLTSTLFALLDNNIKLSEMSVNAKKLALPHSAKTIANKIINSIGK